MGATAVAGGEEVLSIFQEVVVEGDGRFLY
jgi:hypothetical protein